MDGWMEARKEVIAVVQNRESFRTLHLFPPLHNHPHYSTYLLTDSRHRKNPLPASATLRANLSPSCRIPSTQSQHSKHRQHVFRNDICVFPDPPDRHPDPLHGHARLVRRRLRSAKRPHPRLHPHPLHRVRAGPRMDPLHPLQLPPLVDKRPVRRLRRHPLLRRLHRRRVLPALRPVHGLREHPPRRGLGPERRRRARHRPQLRSGQQQAVQHAQGVLGVWHHERHLLLRHGLCGLHAWGPHGRV